MKPGLTEIWVFLAQSPLLWLSLTLLAYLAALGLYRLSGANPFANPVLIAVTLIVAVLTITRTPYATYFEGAKFVHFLIGPATVALAIPLYSQLERLRRIWLPLTAALLIGVLSAMTHRSGVIGSRGKLLLTTGMMGGLSTFSSFVWGTDRMLANPAERASAIVYLVLSMVAGLVLVEAGLWLGRRLSSRKQATAA